MDLLAAAFERVDIGLCLLDSQDQVISVNDSWLEIMGVSCEQPLGSSLALLLPGDPYGILAACASVREGGDPGSIRFIRTVGDEECWFENFLSPIPLVEGPGLLLSCRDVSSLVQADRERERLLSLNAERASLAAENARLYREAELERFRWLATVESMLDPVAVADADGSLIYINGSYRRYIGRQVTPGVPLEDQPSFYQIYRSDGTLFPPEELPLLQAVRRGEAIRDVEIVQKTPDGQDRVAVWNASPLRDQEGRLLGAVAVGRDITAQRQAEEERTRLLEELLQRNQRLATASMAERLMSGESRRRAAELDAVLASIADGLIIYRSTGELGRMNPAAERILGLPATYHHDPLGLSTPIGRVEDASGQPFSQEDLPVSRALRGETVQGVVMVIRGAAKRGLRIRVSAAPIRAAGGRMNGAVVTFTDITALHRLQGQRDELIQLISQDLRAPLTVILGHAQMMQRSMGEAAPLENGADVIVNEARRMNLMIQELVDMAQMESGMLRLSRISLDMRRFSMDVGEWLSKEDARRRIVIRAVDSLPPVMADPVMVERVLAHLLSTAMSQADRDADVAVSLEEGVGGVLTSIQVPGGHASPSELDRMFERDEEGELANGLTSRNVGLYMSRMLVEAHEGKLWAEMDEHQGLVYRFFLPSAIQAADDPPEYQVA